ncbi:N-6 DNA methylase [uncultured Chryseobacterium sp.]|uniref:N-6 DNA methylase n=1 Tax=uncultured Chryseobacterium sp. TaxID=259322 RepID=UPI0025D12672|nr:N-6 DNA methylase [uncultured Chryseobacterium sp.]
MTLHEAIVRILKENGRPMSADDIALAINSNRYYERNDREPLNSNQINIRVKNYPSLFENINGIIILSDDYHWKNIITSYLYLKEILRGIFSESQIQFIIAVLFFYKRLIDINERPGRGYPFNFIELEPSINHFIDGGKEWISSIKEIDRLSIAPDRIFTDLAEDIFKLDSTKREAIRRVILQVNTSSFSDFEFGNIYEYLLYLSSREHFNYENSTPESIRILISKLLRLSDGDSVYDPVSGLGGLLTKAYNLNRNIRIKGSEINKRIAQLGNMNIMMYGGDYLSSIVAEDCFSEINNENKYEYIIGDLPIKGITNSYEHFMLYNHYNVQLANSGKSFNSLVLFSYYKLSAAGKAIVTVSDSFLTKRGKEKEIRKILIDDDVVEAIISLPRGTFRPYTEAKASILIINKDKPNYLKNKVKFIKISAVEETKKYLLLDNERIVHEYFSEASSPKFTQIIDIEDLDSELSLSAEKYDIEFSIINSMLKDGTGKQLKDIARIVSGKQPSKQELVTSGDLPIIKIENLSKDILDINLNVNYSDLDLVRNEKKFSASMIDQESILIAKIGDNLKPTIFKPTELLPKILIHSGVFALMPLENVDIDLNYLYYQLNSIFIDNQINSRRVGSPIPYLNKTDIEKVIIPYDTLEVQAKFINTQKINLIAEENRRFEERKKALGYEEEIKDTGSTIIKALTHQLNPKFLALSNLTKRIDLIVKNNKLGEIKEYNEIQNIDPDLLDLIIEAENNSLSELILTFVNDSEYLAETIDNVDKALNTTISPDAFEKVDIKEFLNEYVKQKKVLIGEAYKIVVKGNSIITYIDKSFFKEALDNLLINAEKHGFINKNNKSYQILFNIKENLNTNTLIIEYSNNGERFKLTQKDFVTPFVKGTKSSGFGIGGNLISKVIEVHDGAIKIDEKYKNGFFLTIEIPIKNNEEYE